MTYALGGSLGETAVPPGTNLLVTGPPLSGKRRLGREILRRGVDDGQGAVVITARDTARRVRQLFDASDGNGEALLGIVDCVTEHVGRAQTGDETTSYASSPGDVTEIGIKFAEFVEYFHCERGTPHVRVLVDSITTLLQYSTLQAAFRFLHAVTTRIAEVEGVGVFVVESTVHDAETMDALHQLFDGVVETNVDGPLTVDVPAVEGRAGVRPS